MAGQLGTGWWEQQSRNSVVSSRVLNGTPTDVWLWGVQPRDVFTHMNWDADGGSDNCQVAHSQGNAACTQNL